MDSAAQRARRLGEQITELQAQLLDLSEQRRDVLRQMRDSGLTEREIAAEVGLSQQRVWQVLRGGVRSSDP